MRELFPREIAPGWAKRWTRQTWELWTRAPGWFLVLWIGTPLVTGPLPGDNSWVYTFFLLIAQGISYGALQNLYRSADRSSHQIGQAWLQNMNQTMMDLTRLIWVIGLYCMALGLVISLFTHGIAKTFQTISMEPPSWPNAVANMATSLLMLCFWPGVAQLVYLTLREGNHPRQWFRLGYAGCLKNLPVLVRLQLPAMGVCFLILFTPTKALSPEVGSVLVLGLDTAFLWFGGWSYLFCREMFEGEAENQTCPEKTRQTGAAPIPAGQS